MCGLFCLIKPAGSCLSSLMCFFSWYWVEAQSEAQAASPYSCPIVHHRCLCSDCAINQEKNLLALRWSFLRSYSYLLNLEKYKIIAGQQHFSLQISWINTIKKYKTTYYFLAPIQPLTISFPGLAGRHRFCFGPSGLPYPKPLWCWSSAPVTLTEAGASDQLPSQESGRGCEEHQGTRAEQLCKSLYIYLSISRTHIQGPSLFSCYVLGPVLCDRVKFRKQKQGMGRKNTLKIQAFIN